MCQFWFQARIEAEDLDNAEELDDEDSNDDIVSLLEEALDDNSNNHDDLPPVVDSPAVGESGANNNSNLLSVKEPAYSKKKVQTKPGNKVIANNGSRRDKTCLRVSDKARLKTVSSATETS